LEEAAAFFAGAGAAFFAAGDSAFLAGDSFLTGATFFGVSALTGSAFLAGDAFLTGAAATLSLALVILPPATFFGAASTLDSSIFLERVVLAAGSGFFAGSAFLAGDAFLAGAAAAFFGVSALTGSAFLAGDAFLAAGFLAGGFDFGSALGLAFGEGADFLTLVIPNRFLEGGPMRPAASASLIASVGLIGLEDLRGI